MTCLFFDISCCKSNSSNISSLNQNITDEINGNCPLNDKASLFYFYSIFPIRHVEQFLEWLITFDLVSEDMAIKKKGICI